MKILYLCSDLGIPVLGRKGAAVHVREMIQAMRRAGHIVQLVAPVLQKSPWEKPAVLDVPITQIRPSVETSSAVHALRDFNKRLQSDSSLPGDLRRILYNQDLEADLFRRFDAEPPDVIYERASLFGMAGAGLARQFGCPLVLEVNAPLVMEQTAYRATALGELAGLAERAALGAATAVFVVSDSLFEHVISLGVDLTRARMVPNGIDPAHFYPAPRDPAVRERFGLGEAKVLGFVGGLRPWHGIEVLPALIEALLPGHPDLKMLIVGDGQLRPSLEQAFIEKKQRHHVIFSGALLHAEIPAVIRQFDVALAPYPSASHSFYFSPLKLFEYLGCGVATLAAELGQIKKIIQHGETGWLYPAGDFAGLVTACDQLLKNPDLRQRLGQQGASRIHEFYTWDHNVRQLEEVVANFRTGSDAGVKER